MNRPRIQRPMQPQQPQQPMQRVSPGMYRNAQGMVQRGNQPIQQRPMPPQRPMQPQQNQMQQAVQQIANNPWGQSQQSPNLPPNGWGHMGQLNLQGTNPGNWSAGGGQPQGQWSGFAGGFGQMQQGADQMMQGIQDPNQGQQDQLQQAMQRMQKYPRPAYQPPANPQGILSQPPMKQ